MDYNLYLISFLQFKINLVVVVVVVVKCCYLLLCYYIVICCLIRHCKNLIFQ